MFRGWELVRLMSMVVMLTVLGAVIFRARQPESPPPADESADLPVEEGPKTASRVAVGEEPASKASQPVSDGPSDEDPEQQADAAEEFQAVSDGTLGIQPEEMLAYWRLFYWTEHQSLETLEKRVRGKRAFNDFMQFPDKERGKLVRLDLNVRRVLAYDVKQSPFGIKRLYEIWGWTDDSKAWLYCVVTAHLPEGMPIGADVYERARFVGYFFKLQGYHEAGAKPHARPLRAPLLVGRLRRYPSLTEQQQAPGEDWWTLGVVGGMCLFLAGVGLFQYRYGRQAARHQAERQSQAAEAARQWLRAGLPTGNQLPVVEETVGDENSVREPTGKEP